MTPSHAVLPSMVRFMSLLCTFVAPPVAAAPLTPLITQPEIVEASPREASQLRKPVWKLTTRLIDITVPSIILTGGQKKKDESGVWEWISDSAQKQTRGKRKAESDRPEHWKFKCRCGEVCSSYENPREYPAGRMYECTKCNIWSHVSCVLGTTITDAELATV